jgi:type I site-specific restriction endonuclease
VIKVHIDRDVDGYRPEIGDVDRDGHEIEDRIYNQEDFDRTLVLDDRTKLVAAPAATPRDRGSWASSSIQNRSTPCS